MSAVNINTILPRLHASLRDCPVALIVEYTLRAIQEFCRMTDAYRVTASVNKSTGVITNAEANTYIHKLLEVYDDGDPLMIGSQWRHNLRDKTKIIFVEDATGYGTVTATISVIPTDASTSIADASLFQRWREAFTDGAQMFLFMLKDKPWTSAELGQFHQARFVEAMNEAKEETRQEQRETLLGGL